MEKTILIVEDDKFLLNIYKLKFGAAGFNVSVASDGAAAIEFVTQKIPNVILLDLLMPKKDGFQVLKELKENPNWKSIPVIVASNLGQTEDLNKAMALGATNYFIKSNVRIDEVVDTVLKSIPPSSS